MALLQNGDSIGLISCSDGLRHDDVRVIHKIEQVLENLGITVVKAATLFRDDASPFSGSPQMRASELMRLFHQSEVKAIFDVSGGDSANQILPFLDFDAIRRAATPYIGISDLSVINNAINTCASVPSHHYRIKNLAGHFADSQTELFQRYFMEDEHDLTFEYRWLRGQQMNGVVIGGNIRCFLKLAGTRYFPDPTDKIIFLEALGGGPARMASLLAQMDQLSVFSKCAGVLLGTFSEMQKKELTPSIEALVFETTEKYNVPIAKTEQLGHGEDAHILPIGVPIVLE
ncbi:LD-carboxypeptidase [Sporolactobacillus laevolacticus]|uniref:LD-carboxypeptidase n=1 Tax=Sporolactobacillus laevolacticus TaxID=33018 RepID=UPI0025B49132|nr:LD-carboxypeptidase [Sporolactobacillus laevolacticus]MDN3956118.1 LD-carboxypeptidase [Sporolactobacillus laevolacticus]